MEPERLRPSHATSKSLEETSFAKSLEETSFAKSLEETSFAKHKGELFIKQQFAICHLSFVKNK